MLLDAAEQPGKGFYKMQSDKSKTKCPFLIGPKMMAKGRKLKRALDVRGKVQVSCRGAVLLHL